MQILIIFLLQISNSSPPSLDTLLSQLSSLTNYSQATYISQNNFHYLKIATASQTQGIAKANMLILSGLYAGYMENINFVLNLTSSILKDLNSSSSSLNNTFNNINLYIIPVTNEAAYSKYQNNPSQVFVKDQVSTQNCTEIDIGINADHDFSYLWTSLGTYGNPCSQDYSGPQAYGSLISSALKTMIRSLNPVSILNYNREGNIYYQPYSCDKTISLSNWQSLIYKNISSIVPSSFKFGKYSDINSNTSCGCLLDYSANLNVISLDVAVSDSFSSHQSFFYTFFNYFTPGLLFSVGKSQATVISSTVNNVTTLTENICLNFSFHNTGYLTVSTFQVYLSTSKSPSTTFNIVNSTANFGFNSSTTIQISLTSNFTDNSVGLGFSVTMYQGLDTSIEINLSRNNETGNNIDWNVQLSQISQNIANTAFSFSTIGGNKPSTSNSDNGDKNSIIAASFVLVAINIGVIIAAVIWKLKGKN